MVSFRILVVGIFALLLSFCGRNAFASDNGVFKLELPDAAAVGMGGAFTGEADRPSAVYYNPAGIVQMDTIEASVGVTLVQPQLEYKSPSGNAVEMNRDNYIFPDVFVTTPLIKDKLYLGIGESTDFGGGNDWAANSLSTFTRYSTVKDSMENQDYRLVAAYKISEQWSVGAGATNEESKFEHDQALNQGAGADGDALFKANDNSWGFDLATMFKLNGQNQFGLDYKSPIQHQYSGTMYLNGLNTSNNDYEAIFGGTSFQTKAIQKLTMPQSVTLGYDLKPTNKWTINFDLEWTDWSQYKEQTTYYPNLTNSFQKEILGTDNPSSRDWTSVWSESVGVQYAVTDKFRVRTGYEHHQTPVPEATFNTEFPDSDSNAVTAGIGYDITSRLTVDIAYVADFEESRNVVNSVDSSLGANLSGKYKEFVNIGTASLTYKF